MRSASKRRLWSIASEKRPESMLPCFRLSNFAVPNDSNEITVAEVFVFSFAGLDQCSHSLRRVIMALVFIFVSLPARIEDKPALPVP